MGVESNGMLLAAMSRRRPVILMLVDVKKGRR
jgi:hypothetical protein